MPATSYAVLGLLSFGEALSGYELRKWAESLRFFYWSPAQSQIYSELRRLEKRGLVTKREVPQEGKPDKKMHSITEAGLTEFKRWLNEGELEPTVLKHGLALRIFFGHAAEPGRLKALLHEFIERAQTALNELGIVQEYTQNTEGFAYPALVADWGEHYYKAEIEFAEKLLKRLED